jgi:branched-chain amino acid transport system substrate-binding protein
VRYVQQDASIFSSVAVRMCAGCCASPGASDTEMNVRKQAAHLDLELGMLRPGIKVTTSPTDYQPIKQLFLIQFDGQDWAPIGN